jgi:hypothetical protein
LASRTFREVRAFEGTLPQRITGYHSNLDVSGGKKIRGRCTERLSAGSSLVGGTAAEVDICSIRAVVVSAVTTTKVVDGLPGKALGGETGAGDDFLAVLIGVAGVCGLVARHNVGIDCKPPQNGYLRGKTRTVAKCSCYRGSG